MSDARSTGRGRNPGCGFSVSSDGAETWKRPDDGLQDHYLWGLAVDGSEPETVVVSAAPSPFDAHGDEGAESTIYRRSRGNEWVEVRDGLPPREGTNAAVLTWHSGTFYAASNRGLFRSDDGGSSWQHMLDLDGRAQALVVTN